MLASLTSKGYDDWDVVNSNEDETITDASYAALNEEMKTEVPKKKID